MRPEANLLYRSEYSSLKKRGESLISDQNIDIEYSLGKKGTAPSRMKIEPLDKLLSRTLLSMNDLYILILRVTYDIHVSFDADLNLAFKVNSL